MPIEVGDQVPSGIFDVMTADGPGKLNSDELFGGRKVVLFSLPGAFTPTCSKGHLPGFVRHADDIRASGVDEIACMAVNDVWVMGAWAKDQGVGDRILMLADGNATYSGALGLTFDGSAGGMGIRGQRFAMIVEDGTVTDIAIEAPRKFEVSSAEAILAKLGQGIS
jgi:peroxiredoxin